MSRFERLRQVTEQMKRRVLSEMEEIAHEILEEARDLAPRDTGELVESGYVEQLEGGGYTVGFRAAHAAVQHERMDLQHPDGGGPKFLERALDSAAQRAQQRLADAAGEALQ